MFLTQLNTEQKTLFLDMCILCAMADEDFMDSEKHILAEYCKEMNIPYTEIPTQKSFSDVVDRIVDISTDTERRMIGLELMGMVMADGIYQEEEQAYIATYSAASGLSMDTMEEMRTLVEKVYGLKDDIERIVLGK